MVPLSAEEILKSIDIWCRWEQIFGNAAEEMRHYFTGRQADLQKVLLHLLTARGTRPTKKWRQDWAKLRSEIPDNHLRKLLMSLTHQKVWYAGLAAEEDRFALAQCEVNGTPYVDQADKQWSVVGDDTALVGQALQSNNFLTRQYWHKHDGIWYKVPPDKAMARTHKIAHGACWALADFQDQEVRNLLEQLVRRHICQASWPLAQFGDKDAFTFLTQFAIGTVHKKSKVAIQHALQEVAKKQGLSQDELLDRAVPAHNLNSEGECCWQIEDYRIKLSITHSGSAECVLSRAGGQVCRSLPEEVLQRNSKDWRKVQTEKKALSATLSLQKKRLEQAMVEGRGWSYAQWQDVFSEHPVLLLLATRLVWRISSNEDILERYTIPCADGSWQDAVGEDVQVTRESRLRIVHPLTMDEETQAEWQRGIVSRQIVQPFKQIFRETYVVTPAEEETRKYSNRFSGLIVPRKRLVLLEQKHGWKYNRAWYSKGNCYRDFPTENIRAYGWFERIDDRESDFNTLQQLAFYPLEHSILHYQPDLALDTACKELHEVGRVVFSEALRDFDLFVAAASIDADEYRENVERAAQVQERERQAREKNTVAQVSMRKELLRALLPIVGLEKRVQIREQEVLIKGQRSHYRMELGRGTIYLEPSNRYLCITSRPSDQQIYLPFEENDHQTAEIISKLLLLAQDEQITDPTILRQLPQIEQHS